MALGDVDVVLTPVLTHTTPQIGYLAADLDFETHLERVSAYVGFTPLHNVTGAPAISLPLGRTSDGRPIGVMIQARRGQDRMLLELAHELEVIEPPMPGRQPRKKAIGVLRTMGSQIFFQSSLVIITRPIFLVSIS